MSRWQYAKLRVSEAGPYKYSKAIIQKENPSVSKVRTWMRIEDCAISPPRNWRWSCLEIIFRNRVNGGSVNDTYRAYPRGLYSSASWPRQVLQPILQSRHMGLWCSQLDPIKIASWQITLDRSTTTYMRNCYFNIPAITGLNDGSIFCRWNLKSTISVHCTPNSDETCLENFCCETNVPSNVIGKTRRVHSGRCIIRHIWETRGTEMMATVEVVVTCRVHQNHRDPNDSRDVT